MNRPRLLVSLSIGVLLILAACSIYLAVHRIYQVDEFQNFYMARVQALGQYKEFFTTSSLFLFGPLSWLAASHLSSVGMITGARLIFLGFFWLNLLLVARIAGGPLLSTRGLAALLGAATLAPLWDYGFEVRYDNLVLTGVLLIWWLARARPARLSSYLIAGVLTVALLFTAVKALVYLVPLSFAIIAFPPPKGPSRWKAAAAWLAGAAVTVLLVRLYYGNSGAWDNYLSVFRQQSKYSAASGGSGKFPPWDTLERLLSETPLLLAVTVAALVYIAMELWRRRRAALTWDGLLPEALLCLGALGVLIFINPTPFAYNLVNLVPFAFIFAFKYAIEVGKDLRFSKDLWIGSMAVLIFLHFTPFAVLTYRHVYYSNSRQKELMNLAEQMTDPSKDLVYDAIGMVPTRNSPSFHWYLHSLNPELLTTSGLRVRDFLAVRPAAVLVRSYRTDWLPEADDQFIASRYVPLSDELEVLGKVLAQGGGSFEIVHAGRYCVVPAAALDSHGPATNIITGTLDGTTVSNQPVELTVGKHLFQTSSNTTPAIVWVGPTLNTVPYLSPGDHRFLFQNWY